jgi:hypothetical protein
MGTHTAACTSENNQAYGLKLTMTFSGRQFQPMLVLHHSCPQTGIKHATRGAAMASSRAYILQCVVRECSPSSWQLAGVSATYRDSRHPLCSQQQEAGVGNVMAWAAKQPVHVHSDALADPQHKTLQVPTGWKSLPRSVVCPKPSALT